MKLAMTIILGIFLSFLLVQIWIFYKKIDVARGDLDKLQAELVNVKRDSEVFQGDYTYYLNPANLEKELRARFNYRAPGEKLIVIVPSASSTTSSPQ